MINDSLYRTGDKPLADSASTATESLIAMIPVSPSRSPHVSSAVAS